MTKLKNKKTGFTLTEMLVYIATLSLIVLAICSFIFWLVYSNNKAKAIREVLDNSRRAMAIITQEIKEAKSIYAPTTNSDQLSLETKKYLPAGEMISYLDFYICENRICLKKESQNPIVLTSDEVIINSLTFTQVGASNLSVEVDLIVEYKNPQNRPEYKASFHLNSTVSLRPQ